MKIKYLLLLSLTLLVFNVNAQELSIDGDFRPRFEYRHGFHNLVPAQSEPAAFIQQRSRVKLGYSSEKFKAFFSFQDVRVWGDTRQILPVDANNSFQIAQAWFSLQFADSWSTKIGRQALSYDDQRILGGLDWAMQGRFHDAALVRYAGGNSKLDFGVSFSQNAGSGNPGNETGTIYDVAGFFSYKALQYLHYNVKPTEDINLSFLAMNNTFQNTVENIAVEGFHHRQTFGTHSKFKFGASNLALNAYMQTGESNADTDLSAYLVGLEFNTKIDKIGLGIGAEMQSGNDQDATDGKNRAFFPLYGTNHKFNGYMDYFYVGNHANSVGLIDGYVKANFKTGEKSSLLLKGHYFTSEGTLINPEDGMEADSYLGTEIDIVFTQKLLPYATLKLGYSQMLASDSMELLKNQPNPSGLQNWGWAMLVVKPNFLKWNPEKKDN